jgi:hypothetical protein
MGREWIPPIPFTPRGRILIFAAVFFARAAKALEGAPPARSPVFFSPCTLGRGAPVQGESLVLCSNHRVAMDDWRADLSLFLKSPDPSPLEILCILLVIQQDPHDPPR